MAFYRQELPALGWTIDSDEVTSRGTDLKITNPEYEAKLDFVTSEMGVVLDLTIDPLGQALEIPGGEDGFGESEGLGETGGDFPAGFPVPVGAKQIPVPEKLKSEGYQVVFSYPEPPEMAYMQLITAIMGAGWEIGDFTIDPGTNVFLMPFSDPASGFQGYALLTDDPDVAGMDLAGSSIIALHPGVP